MWKVFSSDPGRIDWALGKRRVQEWQEVETEWTQCNIIDELNIKGFNNANCHLGDYGDFPNEIRREGWPVTIQPLLLLLSLSSFQESFLLIFLPGQLLLMLQDPIPVLSARATWVQQDLLLLGGTCHTYLSHVWPFIVILLFTRTSQLGTSFLSTGREHSLSRVCAQEIAFKLKWVELTWKFQRWLDNIFPVRKHKTPEFYHWGCRNMI